jgi:hypothetical protein
MKQAVDRGLGAMIYVPSFIQTGPAIQKLIRGMKQTHRKQDDRISLFFFFSK